MISFFCVFRLNFFFPLHPTHLQMVGNKWSDDSKVIVSLIKNDCGYKLCDCDCDCDSNYVYTLYMFVYCSQSHDENVNVNEKKKSSMCV